MLLRCIRPDEVVPQVTDYIKETMDDRFIDPPQLDIGKCYEDSSCVSPLIFVLTPGADPMTDLFSLAEGAVARWPYSVPLAE